MKCFTIFFLSFLLVTMLFAERVSDQIEKRSLELKKEQAVGQSYNWESESIEFLADGNRADRSVPGMIDYQGKITNSSNTPISGSVNLAFAIYAASSGGTAIWSEPHTGITATDGLVHVLLGSRNPLDETVFDGSDLWLGINVNSDGEMSPRLRIASVPYAINADNLDGKDSDDFVSTQGDNMTGTLILNTPSNCISATSTSGDCISATSSNSYAIKGASMYNHGVHGSSTSSYGVAGYSSEGSGVYGQSSSNIGVSGYCSPSGSGGYYGINGLVTGGSGTNYGVYGRAQNGTTNFGVYGSAETGVTNYAGYFDGDVRATGSLQVNGTFKDSDGSAGTSGQILSSTGIRTNWIDAAIGDGHSLDAADGSPTDVVYVDNDGKVGVGTTTPAADLDVVGNVNVSTGSTFNINSYPVLSSIGSYNTFLGYRAGGTSGDDSGYNVLVGYQAGWNCIGGNNIFLGYQAGYSEQGSNTLYIENSMNSTPLIYGEFDNDYLKINGDFHVTDDFRDSNNQAGTNGQVLSSTGSGTDWIDNPGSTEIDELSDGKTGGYSVFLGQSAGNADDGNNHYNTGIGYAVLQAVTGGNNTAMGYFSAKSTTGSNNTSLGAYSLYSNTSGGDNVGIGRSSIFFNKTGLRNTAVGYESGYGASDSNITGNTFLGYHAGYSSTGSYNIFLGYGAGESETGSQKLYIESSNSSAPLIYGEFDNDYIKINGDFETTGTATIGDVLHLTPTASAPSSPSEGDIYVDSDDDHIYCFLGGSWKQLDN